MRSKECKLLAVHLISTVLKIQLSIINISENVISVKGKLIKWAMQVFNNRFVYFLWKFIFDTLTKEEPILND